MSIPFSRSMRSLQADKARLSLLGLMSAAILLIVWMAWFFLARMTLYETGQLVRLTHTGTIVAAFPATAAGRVRRGQSAVLQSQPSSNEPNSLLPAIVTDVSYPDRNERVWVTLYPRTDATVLSPQLEELSGRARVAVDRVSPAALFLGSARPSTQSFSASHSSFKR